MKHYSLLFFALFVFRGGGWQGFAALPQPALLQGLSGPRPPADHQRQPLPPHCSLWVHIPLCPSRLSPLASIIFTPSLLFDLLLLAAALSLSLRYHFPTSLLTALFPSLLLFPPFPPGCCPLIFSSHTCSFSVSHRLSLPLFLQSSGCRALSLRFPRQPPSCLEACVVVMPYPLQHTLYMHNTHRYTKIITLYPVGRWDCVLCVTNFYIPYKPVVTSCLWFTVHIEHGLCLCLLPVGNDVIAVIDFEEISPSGGPPSVNTPSSSWISSEAWLCKLHVTPFMRHVDRCIIRGFIWGQALVSSVITQFTGRKIG